MIVMIKPFKRWVNRLFFPFGYRIVQTRVPPTLLALPAALARVSQHIPHIGTVIDIGASNGQWSEQARAFYPSAAYYLIEANPFHDPALKAYSRARPNTRYVLAAAGDHVGEVHFDLSDPFGGVAARTPRAGSHILPMTTVDTEVEKHGLQPPYLIKLDTHGFEVPILEGAAQALTQAQLLVIETYNFRLEPGSLLFYEMCAYLAERGFRPIDLCEPLFRPQDGVLWQFDLFFARASHPVFSIQGYRSQFPRNL